MLANLVAAAALVTGNVVGVTIDDVSHLHRTVVSLRHLPGRPWTREVLDVNRAHPSRLVPYRRSTRRLAGVSHVMAKLADSSELRHITARQLGRRTTRYVAALRHDVDLWEVGNEVNGNWTGRRSTVARKVRATYRAAHNAGVPTALTLYENHRCGDGPQELTPASWSRRFLSPKLRDGLDVVLLSYYEPQCHELRPSRRTWTHRFRVLHRVFPRARLGFGEVGMPHPARSASMGRARSIVRHYYGLRLPLPYFIGGNFYWYYVEDMTPWRQSPLWHVLRRQITQP